VISNIYLYKQGITGLNSSLVQW